MEEWRDVIGYEEYFRISSYGQLFSKRSGKILKQNTTKTGRKTVATRIGGRTGKAICFKIHRLVAEAFIPNPDNKPQVNHKDGNPANNHKDNLEWTTAQENVQHAYSTGLNEGLRADLSPIAKLTQELADEIRKEYYTSKISQRKLAEKYGVSKTTIQNILAGTRW